MLLLLLALAGQVSADVEVDVLTRLAGGVAAERTAVEALADEVARKRAQSRDDIGALQRRRTELEGRWAEGSLLQRELLARTDAHGQLAAADDLAQAAARAPLLGIMADLKQRISALPFRSGSRLERVSAIERAMAGQSLKASTQALWPLLLQEALLLEETAGARQPIVVGGVTLMAEVAHVGPLVWFRAKDPDGATLVGVAEASGWRVVDDVEGRQRITFFFDALRRDAATGLFLLPAPAGVKP